MPDFSLVPVDHQPDFSDASLVPVDHDPFGADGATHQAQMQPAQPENPPQSPATGVGQSGVGMPAPGDGPGGSRAGGGFSPGGSNAGGDPNPASDQGGSSEPAPFSGYANPTPTESLVNKAKSDDQEKLAEADRTGRNGRVIDGGDLYKFVTTKPPIAHYPVDGGTGTVFTTIDPFYAKQGSRYAIIDASSERPVTVTVREDGTFTINRR